MLGPVAPFEPLADGRPEPRRSVATPAVATQKSGNTYFNKVYCLGSEL